MHGAHSSGLALALASLSAASHCSGSASLRMGIASTVPDTLNRPWFGQSNPSVFPVLSSAATSVLQMGQVAMISRSVTVHEHGKAPDGHFVRGHGHPRLKG